jgi:hypothetical protein
VDLLSFEQQAFEAPLASGIAGRYLVAKRRLIAFAEVSVSSMNAPVHELVPRPRPWPVFAAPPTSLRPWGPSWLMAVARAMVRSREPGIWKPASGYSPPV